MRGFWLNMAAIFADTEASIEKNDGQVECEAFAAEGKMRSIVGCGEVGSFVMESRLEAVLLVNE